MNRTRANAGIVVAVLLAVLLLVVSLHGIDWPDLGATIRHAQVTLLALGFGIVNVSLFLRSLRWRVLLSAKLPLKRRLVFGVMSIGYLGDSLLPDPGR